MHFVCYYIVIVKLLILNVYKAHGMGQLYTSDANKTYYIDFERKFSWFDGQIACSRMNMTLVEINTSTKSLELNTLIKNIQKQSNIKGEYLWIGGILSRFPNKEFVWLSTGEHLTYTNWYDNNPDFYNDNEFCIEMVMAENWKWNDDSCITRGGFVCEYKKEIEILQELNNLKQKINNHLQVQSNLQQEVIKQKEQIKHELQKQKQFEEQKLEMEKEIEKYLRRMNESLEKQEKLKENLQTEVKNNEALDKDLQKHKELQQQLQEKLALREEELRKQQELQQQLQLQLQDLNEEKLQLNNQFQTELSAQKDLNQEMQENVSKQHKSLFQISHLQNLTNELLQSSEETNWETKDLQKYELHNNGQNVIIVYSPYRVFFNNLYQKPDNSTTHN